MLYICVITFISLINFNINPDIWRYIISYHHLLQKPQKKSYILFYTLKYAGKRTRDVTFSLHALSASSSLPFFSLTVCLYSTLHLIISYDSSLALFHRVSLSCRPPLTHNRSWQMAAPQPGSAGGFLLLQGVFLSHSCQSACLQGDIYLLGFSQYCRRVFALHLEATVVVILMNMSRSNLIILFIFNLNE